jgi:hypothetical protein
MWPSIAQPVIAAGAAIAPVAAAGLSASPSAQSKAMTNLITRPKIGQARCKSINTCRSSAVTRTMPASECQRQDSNGDHMQKRDGRDFPAEAPLHGTKKGNDRRKAEQLQQDEQAMTRDKDAKQPDPAGSIGTLTILCHSSGPVEAGEVA